MWRRQCARRLWIVWWWFGLLVVVSALEDTTDDETITTTESTDNSSDSSWGNQSQVARNHRLQQILYLEKLLAEYNRSFSQALSGVPTRFDWRDEGKVTPVRDQGSCKACYAFAVTAAIESRHAIEYGLDYRQGGHDNSSSSNDDDQIVLANDYRHPAAFEIGNARRPVVVDNIHAALGGWLSVQQLIDCSSDDTFVNNACTYGYIEESFKYVITFGLVADAVYPFVGKPSKCSYKSIQSNRTFVYNVQRLMNSTNEHLKRLVLDQGPLIALLDDRGEAFAKYRGGLIKEAKQSADRNSTPNHALLIIGWDVDKDGQEYWVVKNSWGRRWGMDGFGHVMFNVRGIGSIVYYPVLSEPAWDYFDTFRLVVVPILLALLIFNLLLFYLIAYFVKLKTVKKRFQQFRKDQMSWIRFSRLNVSDNNNNNNNIDNNNNIEVSRSQVTLEDLEASNLSVTESTLTDCTGSARSI